MTQFSGAVEVARLTFEGGAPQHGGVLNATIVINEGNATITIDGHHEGTICCLPSLEQMWRTGPTQFLLRPKSDQRQGAEAVYLLQCPTEEEAKLLEDVCMAGASSSTKPGPAQDPNIPVAEPSSQSAQEAKNIFDQKTDKGSAELYFHYYGMLQHQQNMLQDMIRTGAYYMAIVENTQDFKGKVVMDVGAGSGILSLFAAQAGARKVYAVEASAMAHSARRLASQNPGFGERVEVVHGKVEEVQVPEKVDVLISEPMGTLLVNERMLETFLYARDHFLKPGGAMFPQVGRIHLAAFTDEMLYYEIANKATFWGQTDFYKVNLTSLYRPALEGYYAQVVVDAFDPSMLVSSCSSKSFDFLTISDKDLQNISIPLNLSVPQPCTIHGIACWFDVLFNGSQTQKYLTTAPGQPTTHWFQLRCVFQQPLVVTSPGTKLQGSMSLIAHVRQSYDVIVNLQGPPLVPGGPPQQVGGKYDLKEPYYRQLNSWYQQHHQTQQQSPVQGQQQQADPMLVAQQYYQNYYMAYNQQMAPFPNHQQDGPTNHYAHGAGQPPPPPPPPRRKSETQQGPMTSPSWYQGGPPAGDGLASGAPSQVMVQSGAPSGPLVAMGGMSRPPGGSGMNGVL